MVSNRKQMNISVAITTYNRFESTAKLIGNFLYDDRVDEIICSDDASTDGSFVRLMNEFSGQDKVILSQQLKNRNMSYNKYSAVSKCKNPFVLIADSDNTFKKTYFDAFYELNGWDDDTIYCPNYAAPAFNYSIYAGKTFDKSNIKEYLDKPLFGCLLNTANYVVPKDRYIHTYEENSTIKAADTVWMNYLWLKAGYKLNVVYGMMYYHLQHEGSHFLENINENMAKAKEIENLIRAL